MTPKWSRRDALHLGGTALGVALAGCSSFPIGRPIYVPIVMQNNHNIPHMISMSITSIPDVGSGWTEFFSDTWYLTPDGEHTFEESLSVPDSPVEVMVLVVLDDETANRAEVSLDFDLRELRVVITENGQIKIQPQRSPKQAGHFSKPIASEI